MEYTKSSIGGWLALLLATMVIRAISYSTDVVKAIQLIAGQNLPAIFSWIIGIEAAAALAVMLSIVYLINGDYRFRKTFAASIILYVVMIMFMITNMASYGMSVGIYVKALFGVGVYAAIWIPYVYYSKRLSNRLDVKEVVAEIMVEGEHDE